MFSFFVRIQILIIVYLLKSWRNSFFSFLFLLICLFCFLLNGVVINVLDRNSWSLFDAFLASFKVGFFLFGLSRVARYGAAFLTFVILFKLFLKRILYMSANDLEMCVCVFDFGLGRLIWWLVLHCFCLIGQLAASGHATSTHSHIWPQPAFSTNSLYFSTQVSNRKGLSPPECTLVWLLQSCRPVHLGYKLSFVNFVIFSMKVLEQKFEFFC